MSKAIQSGLLALALVLPAAAHTITERGWAEASGGRGGRIIKVTSLAAAGPGSLREAIEASGPRIVVFEVGGVIDMGGAPLKIANPDLSIAGQTAPAPGISIIKAETAISTRNVIVQHLAFRPGEFGRPKKGGNDQDGISTLAGARDVIVDHCSFSWATDENLSASGPRFDGATPQAWRDATSHRITFSHNLIFEGLSNSVHVKGEHSKGSLIHDNTSGVLLYGNVYISNRQRSALFKGGSQAAMVNNLIFNPGDRAVHYGLNASEWTGQPFQTGQLTLIGNVLRHGPSTTPELPLFLLGAQGDLSLHMADNIATDSAGRPVGQIGSLPGTTARIIPATQPYLPAGIGIQPAAGLEKTLPAQVGARPWARDAIDARVLADMAAGRGRIIDAETESPLGYPRHAPTRREFKPQDWNLDDMSPKAGWATLAEAR